jgi:hypothetical protein
LGFAHALATNKPYSQGKNLPARKIGRVAEGKTLAITDLLLRNEDGGDSDLQVQVSELRGPVRL